MMKLSKVAIFVLVAITMVSCGRRNIDMPTPTSAVFQPTKTPAPLTRAERDAELAKQGEVIFHTTYSEAGFACASCHYPDQETRLIGPGLFNVGIRGETRVAGLTAREYIRNSILHPNDYVVDGFPADVMPKVYPNLFSANELDALVAYLMTLQ